MKKAFPSEKKLEPLRPKWEIAHNYTNALIRKLNRNQTKVNSIKEKFPIPKSNTVQVVKTECFENG